MTQPTRKADMIRRVRWIAIVLTISACGRLDFNPVVHDGDAHGVDTRGADTTSDIDLVVWLEMTDAPTPQVVDSSGHGNSGSCVTTCPALVPAVRGNGLHFDGVADAVDIADVPELRLPQGTAAMWMRLDTLPPTGSYASIIEKPFGSLTNDTLEIFVDDAGTVTFGGDSVMRHYVGFQVAATTWFHVAITWDGNALVGYLDGAPRTTTGFAVAYDAHPTMLGHDSDNGALNSYMRGTFDDVRIYRRALTAAEIATLATP